MRYVFLMLLLKSTFILVSGILAVCMLQSASAAARHMVWLSTLCILIVLPFGLLLPAGSVPSGLSIQADSIGALRIGGVAETSPYDPWAWAVNLWIAGSAFLMVRLVITALKAKRIVRSAKPARNSAHSVRFTDNISGPAAWSFGEGLIIMPSSAKHWPADQFAAAVTHEMAHIARRDCHALAIGELACALYWIHPLAWYAAHRMRIEQEHAADDLVLQKGSDPAIYASHLVSVVKSTRAERLLAGVGTRFTLKTRIQAILDTRRRRTMLSRRTMLATALAALAVSLPLVALQAERKVYKIGGDVTPPQIIYKEEPKYTDEAKEAKIEGGVLLSGVIEADGRASNIRVERSLDDGLDKNAIAAVQTWLFRPAKKQGEPVAVAVKIEVNFRLL
jgi:TonB family protein